MRRTPGSTTTTGRSQRPSTKVNSSGDDIALLSLGHGHDLKIIFVRPTASASFVQISDRFSFGTQRTNVLPRNDLTRQTVNFVTLRRRPAAKGLHAFQQAEPEDLGILADPRERDRI